MDVHQLVMRQSCVPDEIEDTRKVSFDQKLNVDIFYIFRLEVLAHLTGCIRIALSLFNHKANSSIR